MVDLGYAKPFRTRQIWRVCKLIWYFCDKREEQKSIQDCKFWELNVFCDYFEAFFPSWGDFDVIFKVFLFAVFILSKPICFNERGGKYFDTNFDQQKNWALQFEGFHLFITLSMEIYWMKSVIRTHSSLSLLMIPIKIFFCRLE